MGAVIAELRTTFGGKGELTSQGGLREWSNGKLHALIEPTEKGHRLRMDDSNAVVVGIGLGGFLLAFALLIFVTLLDTDGVDYRLAFPGFIALLGGGLAGASAMAFRGRPASREGAWSTSVDMP